MFQSIKRARFLGKNNFSHWDTGDLVRMHLWLQKNKWPANELVDLFMRAYPDFDQVMHGIAFEHFMCNQYEWVCNDDVKALEELFNTLNSDSVASRVIMFRAGAILCSSPARFSSGSRRSLRAARHVRAEHEQV